MISCYASEETDIITFYNKQFFLVRHIPQNNVRINGGVMNAQIGKDEITNSAYTACQIEIGNI